MVQSLTCWTVRWLQLAKKGKKKKESEKMRSRPNRTESNRIEAGRVDQKPTRREVFGRGGKACTNKWTASTINAMKLIDVTFHSSWFAPSIGLLSVGDCQSDDTNFALSHYGQVKRRLNIDGMFLISITPPSSAGAMNHITRHSPTSERSGVTLNE